jgi:uncharacterized protein YndB with AHSA1/START domain
MGNDSTAVERVGERELVITRVFAAPRALVFRAWSEAELFLRWWVPASVPGMTLVGCDMDVRTGGRYRLEFSFGGADTVAFHGRYLEVVPNERIVWTNDEEVDGAVTTVTFADQGDKTLVRFHELYPSAEALEEAMQGSAAALPEQLDQLAAVLT